MCITSVRSRGWFWLYVDTGAITFLVNGQQGRLLRHGFRQMRQLRPVRAYPAAVAPIEFKIEKRYSKVEQRVRDGFN